MLTFKQFFEHIEEHIFEQKYSVDAADALKVVKDPSSNQVSRIWAGRHLTKANGHSDEDIGYHIRDMASGDAHMKIAAILHPHAKEHLTPEQIEGFKTHPNKKVSAAAQKRWGSDSGEPAVAPAPLKQKQSFAAPAKQPKPTKLDKPAKQPKPAKAEKKAIPAISIQSGNPEDHGLPKETKITHALKNNKSFATAISSIRPAFGELDRDETIHQAFVGDHSSKDGLAHIGNYPTHKDALLAAVKHTKK